MPLTLTEKIILSHIAGGAMGGGAMEGGAGITPPEAGTPIALRIDQTLTQDATGTMAYLQFEGMGKDRVQTELSVSYVDHNTLQEDYKNPDDHRYLQSAAARFGVYFSRPGNGICHQVHLEKFGAPGKTLLGSDSHTPTGGGLGMLAIGAGGLDVAVAMAGGAFNLPMPKVFGVKLTGQLSAGVSAKDVILEVLRRETVKGGVGAVYEYFGEGIAGLSVPERATITNMGAELGATSSIFPSDEVTRAFLAAAGREDVWRE
ncbi:MAG: aconitate hydratase, partial [Spirochaetaceae bacterium]|nr:aconitate hydratase [Spirochaetaceae bacterium]